MHKTFYKRSTDEIEIKNKQQDKSFSSYSPTESMTLSTYITHSPNQKKNDKNNEINMISTGVVRNLRMFFSQTSSALSTSPITTSNRKASFLKKKSYEQLHDLKKSQSVQFEKMNEKIKSLEIEKTRSNNFLNEIENAIQDQDFASTVNINARRYQFSRRNSLIKESKNFLKRKNSNSKNFKFNKFERDEFRGSLNCLDKIEDTNENNRSSDIINYDDSSVATTFSEDYMFDDNSSSISKKDSTLSLNLNENEVNEKNLNQIQTQTFDKNKFDQNISSIFSILNELKKENELLETFFLNLQIKIQTTSVELRKNFDEIVNWIDDETCKKSIERGNFNRLSIKQSLIKHKF